jgi:hypothetical protein
MTRIQTLTAVILSDGEGAPGPAHAGAAAFVLPGVLAMRFRLSNN